MQLWVGRLTCRVIKNKYKQTQVALSNAKPEGAKGKYIKTVHVTSTMGKSFPVEVATVDPRSSRFMLSNEPAAGSA